MPDGLSLADELCFTTIRIDCLLSSGKQSIGTGFLFAFTCVDDTRIPLLITNRHVVSGAKAIRIQITRSTEEGRPIVGDFEDVLFETDDIPWMDHPDPTVDLCAIPMGPVSNSLRSTGARFFYRSFCPEQIANEGFLADLSAMEEVVMVGYPAGLWDQANNMPIFRKGITATRPDLDYEGRKEFLVDMACFPGSSGSPVIFAPTSARWTRKGNLTLPSGEAALLGILYAGPQHTIEGAIEIRPVPTSATEIVTSDVPMNLGVVIKAEQIMPFKGLLEALEGAIPIRLP